VKTTLFNSSCYHPKKQSFFPESGSFLLEKSPKKQHCPACRAKTLFFAVRRQLGLFTEAIMILTDINSLKRANHRE
jgi:hypothetical protein